jgi:hypothetical protein
MVFLSRSTTVAGRRRYFWIFDLQLHLPKRDKNDEARMTLDRRRPFFANPSGNEGETVAAATLSTRC